MNCPKPETLVNALYLSKAVRETLGDSASKIRWTLQATSVRWRTGTYQRFLETRWNDDKYFSIDEKTRILTLFTTYVLEG